VPIVNENILILVIIIDTETTYNFKRILPVPFILA
jgi:hypothetical protein